MFHSSLSWHSCCIWYKDTNLKANHNWLPWKVYRSRVVVYGTKILIWKQITTLNMLEVISIRCCIWYKDTNLKANHNTALYFVSRAVVVVYGTKILIWKQITTGLLRRWRLACCCIWYKDTNLKANHNFQCLWIMRLKVVVYGTKILIWKQITTVIASSLTSNRLLYMVQRY